MNELTIDGKLYISSKKAAEITGYAKDYVGQLCREGHVDARMVGRSWYVLESSIRAHRFGGDAHAAPVEEKEPETTEVQAPNAWGQATYVPDMAPSMPIPTFPRTTSEPLSVEAVEASVGGEGVPTAETLTDMQAAWKEWFAQKQDTLIETPEIIDAREEEHEREAEIEEDIQEFKETHHAEEAEEVEEEAEPVSIVPMHEPEQPQYEEIEEESEPVAIHHSIETPRYTPMMREEAVEEEYYVPTKKERHQAMVQARKARKARTSTGFGSNVVRAILLAVIVLTIATAAIGTGFAGRYVKDTAMLLPIFDFLGGTSTYTK